MQQSDDLSPLEIVEMFAGLSCFLKDSSGVSQTLLDDFRMCQGYAFLCDLMLRCNQISHVPTLLAEVYFLCVDVRTAGFCLKAGTGEGGRIQRCAEGPGQLGHLSVHLRGDRAETCRSDNRSPLPAARIYSPSAIWERYGSRTVRTLLLLLFYPLFLFYWVNKFYCCGYPACLHMVD